MLLSSGPPKIHLNSFLLQKRHTLIPKGRLTEKIELCLTSLNRGWLNAVAWELVPKILGRETEVTS
jgi:hypothetical protein